MKNIGTSIKRFELFYITMLKLWTSTEYTKIVYLKRIISLKFMTL